MSHVFPRHTRARLPMVDHGDGVYLVDTDGKRYLDASGGAAVSCLGHSDPAVTEAIRAQLGRAAFAHTGFFTSEPAETLADRLIEHAPDGIDRVYFLSGGSEAIEAAIKLARQYVIEIGQSNRTHIIARRQSYHGNTLGALAAGGNMWRREPFAPLMIGTSHIPPCYAYREQHDGESDADYGLRAANALEAQIEMVGADKVLAFIAEPVVGATAGAVPPAPGYFKRIREICDKHGVLLILDEVMCGMGRTGSLYACAQEGISPDILTIAKGLGAGYQPVGAMLCSAAIYEAIENGTGFFQHGHTYMGHPTACAGALAVVNKMIGENLPERVKQKGEVLRRKLEERFGQHPHVGDIRGRGLFMGLELVADRDTKTPFDPKLGVNKIVKKAAFEAGLICYPMGGTIDGRSGDHILLAPPFIIEDSQLNELVEKLAKGIEAGVAAH